MRCPLIEFPRNSRRHLHYITPVETSRFPQGFESLRPPRVLRKVALASSLDALTPSRLSFVERVQFFPLKSTRELLQAAKSNQVDRPGDLIGPCQVGTRIVPDTRKGATGTAVVFAGLGVCRSQETWHKGRAAGKSRPSTDARIVPITSLPRDLSHLGGCIGFAEVSDWGRRI
ncbi:hypothetical protein KC338_g96 [Hortaea werneckii]|nr:hypothetical protein KC338_g96 [Hortaea werneckii]